MMSFCYPILADPDDPLKTTDQTRRLGLIVSILTFLLSGRPPFLLVQLRTLCHQMKIHIESDIHAAFIHDGHAYRE